MPEGDSLSLPKPETASPTQLYSALIRRWPRTFVLAVLGGLLGLGAALVIQPLYLATARISVGIDYARAEFKDEDAEQHTFARVQDLLLSDEALGRALKATELTNGAVVSLDEFRKQIRLTRIEAEWSLAVTDPNPLRAAELANGWAAASLGLLEESQKEAWRLAELQALFFRFACRPPAQDEGVGAPVWVCDELQGDPPAPALEAEILQRLAATYGVPPMISFTLLEHADTPDQAATTPRAVLGLIGTVLGLIPGAAWALWADRNSSQGPDLAG